MLLGLSKIIDCPGASLPFSVSVDLSDLCYGVSYPVTEPVVASGTVRNTAGVLMMEGELTTTIHGTCDRCASPFDREIRFPINVVLVTELADEESGGVMFGGGEFDAVAGERGDLAAVIEGEGKCGHDVVNG